MSLWLADANILVRPLQAGSPQGPLAGNALTQLLARGETVCLVPQVAYEFWAVCTRPIESKEGEKNGLGFTPNDTLRELQRLQRLLTLREDIPAIYPAWVALVSGFGVSGRNAHDARLVAAMQVHGLTHLLTFNAAHFRRYPGLTVVEPHQV